MQDDFAARTAAADPVPELSGVIGLVNHVAARGEVDEVAHAQVDRRGGRSGSDPGHADLAEPGGSNLDAEETERSGVLSGLHAKEREKDAAGFRRAPVGVPQPRTLHQPPQVRITVRSLEELGDLAFGLRRPVERELWARMLEKGGQVLQVGNRRVAQGFVPVPCEDQLALLGIKDDLIEHVEPQVFFESVHLRAERHVPARSQGRRSGFGGRRRRRAR